MNEIINEIILKMIAMKVFEYTRMAAVILAFLGIVNLTCSLIASCLQMRRREEEEQTLTDSLAGDGFIVMDSPAKIKVEGNRVIKGGDE